LKRFVLLVVPLRNPSAAYELFAKRRVKHIIWDLPESGVIGIHLPIMEIIEHKVMQSKGGNWFAGCHISEVIRRNGCGSGIV